MRYGALAQELKHAAEDKDRVDTEYGDIKAQLESINAALADAVGRASDAAKGITTVELRLADANEKLEADANSNAKIIAELELSQQDLVAKHEKLQGLLAEREAASVAMATSKEAEVPPLYYAV